MITGSWNGPLQVTLQVCNYRRSHVVSGLCPCPILLPEGLTHRRASLYWHPVRWYAVRMPTVDVNHPYLSHPMRGWGRSFGAQCRELAISGLLPV